MNTVNKLIIALFLAFSFNAMASNKIESITLSDYSNLDLASVSKAFLQSDNSIDYIELNDGSRIEGSEVKEIQFSKFSSRIQTRAAVRTGGDGSGG